MANKNSEKMGNIAIIKSDLFGTKVFPRLITAWMQASHILVMLTTSQKTDKLILFTVFYHHKERI